MKNCEYHTNVQCTCEEGFCQHNNDLKEKKQSEIDNFVLFLEWMKRYPIDPEEIPSNTARKFIKWRDDWFKALNN